MREKEIKNVFEDVRAKNFSNPATALSIKFMYCSKSFVVSSVIFTTYLPGVAAKLLLLSHFSCVRLCVTP